MTIKKESCKTCIHQFVCAIYAEAKKFDETSTVSVKANYMNQVCGQYLREDKNE